jgi:hypothetical protein
MAAETIFAVFEDFNEKPEAPAPQPPDDPLAEFGDIGEIRETAWTEGYMAGRLVGGVRDHGQEMTARLLTSVHDLSGSTSEAVDMAALVVADLLVNTVIAATSDGWSARLLDRVRMVADRLKPALAVAPEFLLRDESGTVLHFNDITDLSRALDTGAAGEDVTIRWQRGEATISRMALLEDLRDAIIPLSAGHAQALPPEVDFSLGLESPSQASEPARDGFNPNLSRANEQNARNQI